MGNDTNVEVLSLEDFHQTLSGRLAEVDHMLELLNTDPSRGRPPLGTFADGQARADAHETTHHAFFTRVRRLREAIAATQYGTAKILEDYKTTEERQAATVEAINASLNVTADVSRTDGGS